MKEVQISRSFSYNGITLHDPNPALSPDAVCEFYSAQYPELANAVVEGPVTKNNVSTYSFQRAAGAKGRGNVASVARCRLQAIAKGQETVSGQGAVDMQAAEQLKPAAAVLTEITTRRSASRPLHMPSGAFGIWG